MKLRKEYAMVVLCCLLCLMYRVEIITKWQKEELKGIPLEKRDLLFGLSLTDDLVTTSNSCRKLYIS
jgi:hypothetical protein